MLRVLTVFVLISNVAFAADDYRLRLESARCQVADAVYQANELPTYTPLPAYEYFRSLAIEIAHEAEYDIEAAEMWANTADGWWKEYSKLMVMRATNQYVNPTTLAKVKSYYDTSVKNCNEKLDLAFMNAKSSLVQTSICKMYESGK